MEGGGGGGILPVYSYLHVSDCGGVNITKYSDPLAPNYILRMWVFEQGYRVYEFFGVWGFGLGG